MSPNKNKGGYKNYVENYGGKSNMRLVYILIGLTLLTVALVVLLVLFLNGSFDNKDNTQSPSPNQSTVSPGSTTPGQENTTPAETSNNGGTSGESVSISIDVEAEQIPEGLAPSYSMGTGDKAGYILIDNALKNKGDLILVNSQYPLDATYTLFKSVNIFDEARNIMSYELKVSKTSLLLERRALSAMVEMLKGAAAAGNERYFVDKAHTKDDEVQDYQTGLSFDLGILRNEAEQGKKFAELPQGQWVMNNAYLYGFTQRYTAEKTSITGVPNDSTNYRYVGFPHSYVMKSKNMCLEEYVEYVRRSKNIKVIKNEKLSYEIMYEYADPNSADLKTACKLSDEAIEAHNQGKAKFTVSGDNFGGFIVTVIYS